MEILKKILYGVLGLLALCSLFILICVLRPGLADRFSEWIYEKRNGNERVLNELNAEGMLNQNLMNGQLTADGAGREAGASAKSVQSTGLTSEELLKTPEPPEGYSLHAGSDSVPERRASEVTARWKEIDAPTGVTGRNGYIPIQEETEQLDDETAKKLREQYTYGETGEGLTFDESFYPYYGMLNETERSLYRQIYANTQAVNGSFNPVVQVSMSELRNVFMAVFNDHPELFWLESAYRGRFDRSGKCVEIILQFNALVDRLDAAKSEFQANAEEILMAADRMSTDYEVEVYIHNALLDRITYDLGASLNQSAYSALVNGRTVCAGYARAFQYLMTQMGIPCYYCTGYAGENHAWNIVRLDGEYYNVDVTWDDTEPNNYNFFNKTDADYSFTHMREDMSVRLPACNGTKYSNLESTPPSGADPYYASARSLEETGFSQEQVLNGLEAYYNDCYRQLIEKGGSCQFQNVVSSESLWLQCYDGYMSDAYSGAYMDQVLSELGKQGCNVDIEAEVLQDGKVLLHHAIGFF